MAVSYAPKVLLRLPPPTSLRVFLHRRFDCAAVASAASALATAVLLRVWNLDDFAGMLAVFGIRKDHMLEAVVIPLLLTSLVYAWSFVVRLCLLASSCGGGDRLLPEACSPDPSGCRRCNGVAELRSGTIYRGASFQGVHDTLLLCGGFKMCNIIIFSPVFFSLGVQLGSVIFGWYASFLFIRTGNLLSPIFAHIFCNMMGLPAFSSPRTRGVASVAFLAGSLSFFWLLFPATSPKLYNTRLDRCSCCHGYCVWK